MNPDLTQLIEECVSEGDARFEARDWGAAKVEYLKGIEAIEGEMRDGQLPGDDPDAGKVLEQLKSKISRVDRELSRVHREWGLAALANREYARAIDELELATGLASDDDTEFLEEVKKHLDRARRRDRDGTVREQVIPSLSRGNDFFATGAFAEAVLEYQEAVKAMVGLPADHPYVVRVRSRLQRARRELIKPYLRRSHRARMAGQLRLAHRLLGRAELLLGDDDPVIWAFLELLRLELAAKVGDEAADEGVEVEAPDAWQAAIREYEESLALYSTYTAADPVSPAYVDKNIYEDRFVESRRRLAALYTQRGERLRDAGRVVRALKNFKEALKLFPRGDEEGHRVFQMIKKLKLELPHPAG